MITDDWASRRWQVGMDRRATTRVSKVAAISQRFLLIAGFLLLGLVLAAYLHRTIMVRTSLYRFEQARRAELAKSPQERIPPTDEGTNRAAPAGDFSEKSNTELARLPGVSMKRAGQVPLAILRIPRIHLEAPVLRGTDEITLNRGVGHIAGMAAPGEAGNIGIAGHRDSFFRDLKNISRGDLVELETTSASTTYVVDRVLVTAPDDTSVLQPSRGQTLTLVTCYPFHFIGPAPRRFVVQASLK